MLSVYQLASFSLGMSQSESAVRFESASRSALKFVGRSISEIVFKCSSLKMLKVETVTNSFKCKKFFVFVEVIHLYIFLFLVQRKAEAQYNKTISEPTLESFV